jgi:hypothetical protein
MVGTQTQARTIRSMKNELGCVGTINVAAAVAPRATTSETTAGLVAARCVKL